MLNAKEEEIMLEESRDVEKDRNGYELWLDANKCDLCYEFCEEKFPDEFQQYCTDEFEKWKGSNL